AVARATVPKKSRTTARTGRPEVHIGRFSRDPCDLRPMCSTSGLPPPTKAVMSTHFEIPRLRILARHALPNVVEGSLIPVALFLVMLHFLGLWGAMIVGLGWSYTAVLRRVVARKRVPGIMILGAVTLSARSALAF